MCAKRRWFERMSGGETKKNPKRKRVKRLEKERKKERKTEEEEGRNNTETVQKQSMPIKCFVALQWKIFSFVLWKFSRRVEAASFSHSFISTLDQSVCIIWQAWKTMRKQISSAEVLIFFSVNSFARYFFYMNRWVFFIWDIFDAFLLFTFDMTGWLWFYYGHFCHAFHSNFMISNCCATPRNQICLDPFNGFPVCDTFDTLKDLNAVGTFTLVTVLSAQCTYPFSTT